VKLACSQSGACSSVWYRAILPARE